MGRRNVRYHLCGCRGRPGASPAALRETILFADLDDEHLDHIAATGSVRSLPRCVVLFDEAATPDERYLVLSGC